VTVKVTNHHAFCLGRFSVAGCTLQDKGHFDLGVVAVVPIFAAAISFATGNRLALGTLEAFQTVRALRVGVALTSAALQILGTAVVSTAQRFDAAVQRIVAVVPISAAAIALASGNLLALGALEALEALRALRVRVAFASARLQVLCTTTVAAAQSLVHFGLRVVAVVPIFRRLNLAVLATGNLLALGTLETFQTVRALRIRVALTGAALQILGITVV